MIYISANHLVYSYLNLDNFEISLLRFERKFNELLSLEHKIASHAVTRELDFYLVCGLMLVIKQTIFTKMLLSCVINIFIIELKLMFKCRVRI